LDTLIISQKITVDYLGHPIVTWESDAVLDNIYVKRWNGTEWKLIGNRLDKVASNKAYPINVFANSANEVIVGWSEAGKIHFKQR
jgi:hypothetical protein